jgi:hypothetical protein
MNGAQTVVGLGGVGLIAVNFWTGPQRAAVGPVVTGAPGASVSSAHTELVQVGAELLFVTVAAVAAGIGPGWGQGMVAVIVGLFILWAIHHYSGGQAQGSATTTAPRSSTTKGAQAA